MNDPTPGFESHFRSIAKGASYRLIATLSTVAISFLMTGSVRLATLIGSSEALTKIALYWAHERFWHRIPWGRIRRSIHSVEQLKTHHEMTTRANDVPALSEPEAHP